MTQVGIQKSDLDHFQQAGFLVVPQFLEPDLVDLLRRVAEIDLDFQRKVRTGKDHSGKDVKLWITNQLGEDIFSGLARYEKMVGLAEQLLSREVYPWHHKFILKDSHASGAWEWHQDYGYWYDYGCLFPDLVSCFIAVDEATRENGCLQIVSGSHRMGRLDTSRVADQTGPADSLRIQSILSCSEIVYCELSPGDAIFFHANTLHRSEASSVDQPRWAFISAYNATTNVPREIIPVHSHDEDAPPTPYEPLERWSREQIKSAGRQQLERFRPTTSQP
jgi:ectoine hydroxylase-related dioxygenase (phytanoyl-CoA dioxygenase family)